MPYNIPKGADVTYSVQREVSDGSLSRVLVRLPYFDKADISVSVDFVPVLTVGGESKYTYKWDGNYILVTPVVDEGATLMLRRSTKIDSNINIFNGQAEFTDESMDENFRQLLYLAQEFTEGGGSKDFYGDMSLHGTLDIKNNSIINLADPVNPTDATNKQFVEKTLDLNIAGIEAVRDQACRCASNAKLSEANASQSETNAKKSETNAKDSETKSATSANNANVSELKAKASELNSKTYEANAKDSAGKASTSETNAKASEGKAKTSETNAKASETNAKTSEGNALKEANRADGEADRAFNEAERAKGFANSASTSASNASGSATDATNEADRSKREADRAEKAAGSLDTSGFVRTVNEVKPDPITGDVKVAGIPIGSIFLAPYTTSWTPEGAVLADGTQYTADQFKQFYDEFLVTGRVMTCNYSQFNADVAKSGGCAKFGIDTSKRTFKVPKIDNGTFVQGGDGTAYEAGLPNITGEWGGSVIRKGNLYQTGAFSIKTPSDQNGWSSQGGDEIRDITFNASKSNPLYGKSNTVQPKSVSMRFYVQLANGSVNQSQMDWARYMDGLNGKANKSDIDRIKAYITETWHSDSSWYRVWSDGFIEQGGYYSTPTNSTYSRVTITFNKAFASGTPVCLYAPRDTKDRGWVARNHYETKISRTSFSLTDTWGIPNAPWYACGY